MAKQTQARPAAAIPARPPRSVSSVPAFGGWEVSAGGGAAAAAVPDYSLDFTNIRAARMQRRTKAMSWSSFVGNAAAVAVETPGGGCTEEKSQWSSAATSDGDDDQDDDRERRRLRRLRSADDRLPIQPGRAVLKGRSKVKGYLFGCVSGQW